MEDGGEPEPQLFVRSIGSGDDDWINEYDLPPEKRKALHTRVDAENEAKAKAAGFPNYAALIEAERAKREAEDPFPF